MTRGPIRSCHVALPVSVIGPRGTSRGDWHYASRYDLATFDWSTGESPNSQTGGRRSRNAGERSTKGYAQIM